VAAAQRPPKWWEDEARLGRWARAARDLLLLAAGLVGLYHETFVVAASDPQLLILFAAMIGLPAFIRADRGGGPP
jgi:hypothetical protein